MGAEEGICPDSPEVGDVPTQDSPPSRPTADDPLRPEEPTSPHPNPNLPLGLSTRVVVTTSGTLRRVAEDSFGGGVSSPLPFHLSRKPWERLDEAPDSFSLMSSPNSSRYISLTLLRFVGLISPSKVWWGRNVGVLQCHSRRLSDDSSPTRLRLSSSS